MPFKRIRKGRSWKITAIVTNHVKFYEAWISHMEQCSFSLCNFFLCVCVCALEWKRRRSEGQRYWLRVLESFSQAHALVLALAPLTFSWNEAGGWWGGVGWGRVGGACWLSPRGKTASTRWPTVTSKVHSVSLSRLLCVHLCTAKAGRASEHNRVSEELYFIDLTAR